MAFDLLTHIKTNNSSEDEDVDEALSSNSLLEALSGFTEVTDAHLVELKAESSANVECSEEAEDPLDDRVEGSKRKSFLDEYQEEEFLSFDVDDEEEQTIAQIKLNKAGNKSKRARICSEIKGQNGHLWSTVKPTSPEGSITEEVPLSLSSTGKGPARNISNPLEMWFLLLDEPILMQLVQHTNEEIRLRKARASHQRVTDLIELRAWLGLNYLCGVFRNAEHNGPLEELWTVELGNPIFRVTMSLKRFEFLAECLQCSDKSKQKLVAVSHMWDKFITNCRSYYAPSSYCAIDEHIVPITDPCSPFKQSLPNEREKKGIRMVSLCDTKTLYMYNAFLAIEPIAKERDVLQLVRDIKGTNRNITLSERYNSLSLTNKLSQHQLGALGAILPTVPELPSELLSSTTQQQLYADTATLTLGLSSNDSPTSLLLSNNISPKINPVKLYQCTRACCQRYQHVASYFSCRLATPTTRNRWPLQFLHSMLDYAAVNAWILLRLSDNGDGALLQRDFLRQLGMFLTQQHLKRRLQYNNKLTLMQKLQLSEILGEPTDRLLSTATSTATRSAAIGTVPLDKIHVPEGVTLMPRYMPSRLRCRKCQSRNGSKTRTRCQQCLTPLCGKHLILRCAECSGVQNVPAEDNGDII